MTSTRSFDTLSYGLGGLLSNGDVGLAEGVAQQLELALTVGLVGDGERLPPEPRLAEFLGVSTLTLRQGLSELRDRGMVETKRGRNGGSFIRDSLAVNVRRARELLATKSVVELRDLCDHFAAVATHAAYLAAERSVADEVTDLQRALASFELASTPSAMRLAYCRLHIEIAVAAQSPRLVQTAVRLLGELAAPLWNASPESGLPARNRHRSLIEAIRSKHAHRAQALARELVAAECASLVARHLAFMRESPEQALEGV